MTSHDPLIVMIPDDEIDLKFILGSGPGGQNKNKVATVAQLRFNVRESVSLPIELKQRLTKLIGNKLTKDGELIIVAGKYRTQNQNRQDAIQRFSSLLERASRKPKSRRFTHPNISERMRRLENKKRRGLLKKERHFHED